MASAILHAQVADEIPDCEDCMIVFCFGFPLVQRSIDLRSSHDAGGRSVFGGDGHNRGDTLCCESWSHDWEIEALQSHVSLKAGDRSRTRWSIYPP